MRKVTIYLGFDYRERLAHDVARLSILRHTDPKFCRIVPLEIDLELVAPLLQRPIEIRDGQMWDVRSDAPQSTEFAISRFLVPFLQKHKGWAAFMDCDIVVQADVQELFALADPKYAVMVVKHDYQPAETAKMDNCIQTAYPRKNWSSVCLWNCEHPANKKLTLEMVNNLPGRDLHRFCWLEDTEIGTLPAEWNHLVGAAPMGADAAKILHYTLGGPWFPGWAGGPMDDAWLKECAACGLTRKRGALPGKSTKEATSKSGTPASGPAA